MPHFDAARARWGVHWHMIGAQKSLVEILLLEFPQFRLKLVLQSHREFRRKPDKLPPNSTHLIKLKANIGRGGYRVRNLISNVALLVDGAHRGVDLIYVTGKKKRVSRCWNLATRLCMCV